MLRVYWAKDLSRAQLLGGPVTLSKHAKGQSLSEHQRDHGPVRLSDLKLESTDEAAFRSRDQFQRTGRTRSA